MFLATSKTRYDGSWMPMDNFERSKIRKIIFFESLTFDDPVVFHDLISSLFSEKWMSESKSAPQITLEGSRTRKKSAKVIDLIWPQLTSVDLRRTGWPVECMSTTWYYMSTFISLAKTAIFAGYVPRNAFSAWHDSSYDVIDHMLGGSGSWHFQGDVKKMGGKL